MKNRFVPRMLLLAMLFTLLPGCQPVPYDAHAQAIDDALQAEYSADYSSFFYLCLGDDVVDQLRAQRKQEQQDVWVYHIETQLPALDAIAPGEIAVTLPTPTIPWNDATDEDLGEVVGGFTTAFCEQLLQALRDRSARDGEAYTLDVTVTPRGDGEGFAVTIDNADDARQRLAESLDPLVTREMRANEAYGLLKAARVAPECYSAAFRALPIAERARIEDIAREEGTMYRVTISHPNIAEIYAKAGDDLLAGFAEPVFSKVQDDFSNDAFDAAVAKYAAEKGTSTLSSFTLDIADDQNNTFEEIDDAVVGAAASAKAAVAKRINDEFYVAVGHAAHYDEAKFAEAFGAKPSDYEPPHPVDGVVTIVKKDDAKADWAELDEQIDDLFAMCEPALLATDDARFASVIVYYTIKHPSAGKYKTDTYTFTAYNTELTLTAYDLRKRKQIATATFGTYFGTRINFNESRLEVSDKGARSLKATQPTIDTQDETSKDGKKAKAFIDKIAATVEKKEEKAE